MAVAVYPARAIDWRYRNTTTRPLLIPAGKPWGVGDTGNLRRLLFSQFSAIICDPEKRHCGANGTITMMHLDQVVHRDPDILGGTPVFRGTRVPIRSLFDYLEGGGALDEFLQQFPSVGRDQAIALLDLAREALAADAPAA